MSAVIDWLTVRGLWPWFAVMMVPLGLAWIVVWRESRLARRLGYDHMGEPRSRSLIISAGMISAALVTAPLVAAGVALSMIARRAAR